MKMLSLAYMISQQAPRARQPCCTDLPRDARVPARRREGRWPAAREWFAKQFVPRRRAAVTIGDRVMTPSGEGIGTVQNLLYDLSEEAVYAVVPSGGLARETFLALPSEALEHGPDEGVHVIDLDAQRVDASRRGAVLVMARSGD